MKNRVKTDTDNPKAGYSRSTKVVLEFNSFDQIQLMAAKQGGKKISHGNSTCVANPR